MVGQHIVVKNADESYLTDGVVVGGMIPTGCCSDKSHFLVATKTGLMVVVDKGFHKFIPCDQIMKH